MSKKILLTLGSVTAIVGSTAAISVPLVLDANESKPATKTIVTTKIYALKPTDKVYTIGFTFGIKDSDLETIRAKTGASRFSDEFKIKLEKAGVANTAPVEATIKLQNSNDLKLEPQFTHRASSAFNIIFKSEDARNPYVTDGNYNNNIGADPSWKAANNLLLKQLKSVGFESIFIHAQAPLQLFADQTSRAQSEFAADNNKLKYYSNFFSNADLQFIKFLY